MSLLKSRQTRFLWDLALNQENTAERDPGVPSRYHCLPHLLSQLRLQLLQGVPAQCPHAHALPYYVQLSSMTFKMMAESSGPNPDLLMQFIMNFWRGKQRIVYELTEITSLSMSIPPPQPLFSFLLHLNGKAWVISWGLWLMRWNIKQQCFQVGHVMLCLYGTHFWLFDFSIVSGKYTVHIYFHR